MLRKTCVERTLMIRMKCREVSLSLFLLVTKDNIQNMQTFLYKNECPVILQGNWPTHYVMNARIFNLIILRLTMTLY